jgi:hypothetical protein
MLDPLFEDFFQKMMSCGGAVSGLVSLARLRSCRRRPRAVATTSAPFALSQFLPRAARFFRVRGRLRLAREA